MRTSTRLAAALAASTILLTGCTAMPGGEVAALPSVEPASGPGWAGTSDRSAGAPEIAPAPVPAPGGGSVLPYTTGVERQIARTASMTVVVDDVEGSAERVHAVAQALDGWVTHESLGLSADAAGSGRVVPAGSWVTLSVPASRLDEAITQVAGLGTVLSRQSSAEDVTDVVVDVDARIASLEASVARLQDLMGRAGSVADIAAVERELASRQADLEALRSQRVRLSGAVERSTLTVALVTPAESTSTNPLQTGWSRGWAAFLESVALVITVVGALLPFALLGALVALPVVLWLRARRRRARAATPDAAPPDVNEAATDEEPDAADSAAGLSDRT